jgi:hypothetical protein
LLESLNDERLTLKDAVICAFQDVKYPGDEMVLSPDCVDDSDVLQFKGANWNTDWRQVPAGVIDYHYESLAFFSPEAHQFYLPAYICRALDTAFQAGSNVLEFTVYDLLPCETSPNLVRHFLLCKMRLSQEQRAVVKRFLDFVRDRCEEPLLSEMAARASEEFWEEGKT